jgi:uncharacterized RDD family membrane protein YckC
VWSPPGFWRRFSAFLLDCMVGAGVWVFCSMWLVIGLWPRQRPQRSLRRLADSVRDAGLALALHIAYHVVLVGGCGQTLGKMALGITVIGRDDGGIPGYGRAALRCLGGFLSLASFGLGYMGIVFTEERRGLADLLAGTRVIEEVPEPGAAKVPSPQAVHLLGV